MLNIQRYENNPILKPDPDIRWMSMATMNAGLWHDESGFHMVFSGGGLGKAYCGDMRLDLEDPYTVLARTREPIMSPETDYEKFGNHDNVVFPCANPVIDGVMHIYYGAADTYVGLATVSVDELLNHVLAHKV